MEVTNQVQPELSTAEVSNDSPTVAMPVMNNGDSTNGENGAIGDSSSLVVETQAEEEHNEQDSEKKERETAVDTCTETEGKQENPKCQICDENEADVAFKPCGHIVVCTGNLL